MKWDFSDQIQMGKIIRDLELQMKLSRDTTCHDRSMNIRCNRENCLRNKAESDKVIVRC